LLDSDDLSLQDFMEKKKGL